MLKVDIAGRTCLNEVKTVTVSSFQINDKMSTCVTKHISHSLWLGCISTVRKNLHFIYQCRYYLLLCKVLCMNTSNHNQFYKCFVTGLFILIRCDDTVKVLSTYKPISAIAERSRTLEYLSLAVPGLSSNSA